MQARMSNPAMIVPGALQALQNLGAVVEKSGLPTRTFGLVHLRASQINGCGVCIDMHHQVLRHPDETEQRLLALAGWRDTPYFTDAERAALALTEAATRMSDKSDPVPDDVWNEVARHFDEPALAALVLAIATTNLWNRINVTTRQVAGEWTKSAAAKEWMEKHAVTR